MTVSAARLPMLGRKGTTAATTESPGAGSKQAIPPIKTNTTATYPPEPIAALAQERWIAVPVHCDPLPLVAAIVLNRSPGLATELRRADRPLTALVGSLMRFPRTRERERTRFEMAGAIAAHVPIWQLDADPGVGVETLADLLLAELGSANPMPARDPATTALPA
jgi:hypothetical protein